MKIKLNKSFGITSNVFDSDEIRSIEIGDLRLSIEHYAGDETKRLTINARLRRQLSVKPNASNEVSIDIVEYDNE